ncbi:34672_t:CDS:2 [Gigaspora margarita]|uniref:34672_t:CDS:1 n=1 Tax=Gigaspora margarita TaxID=4874 RepID=A0ABN7V106_GIGMA|nr:34672_t:CDS:2 [Gigaspora margarita]
MASKDQSKNLNESDSDSNSGLSLKPGQKHNLKPVDVQRQQLEKLLQRVDKPVTIPEIEKPKLKAPKDIVRNVQGSSAGAGSGEFHVYRAHRRREYTRLKIMEEEAKKEEEKQEFEEKMQAVKTKEEERTAKRRAKRQKKKQKKKQSGNKKQKTREDSDDGNDGCVESDEQPNEKNEDSDNE